MTYWCTIFTKYSELVLRT